MQEKDDTHVSDAHMQKDNSYTCAPRPPLHMHTHLSTVDEVEGCQERQLVEMFREQDHVSKVETAIREKKIQDSRHPCLIHTYTIHTHNP